jgi:hypothetical protein
MADAVAVGESGSGSGAMADAVVAVGESGGGSEAMAVSGGGWRKRFAVRRAMA